jgi:hypothetical protein
VIQDAYVKSLTENSAPPKLLRNLKRRVGYTDEEISKTRAKLNRMAVDDPTENTENAENADKPGEKESHHNLD